MMEIKICGLTNFEDAKAAVECGADALGFIFHAPSPRFVTPQRAKEIIGRLPGGICKVGVFVNLSHELINEIASLTGLDLIQLHGDETPEFCTNFPQSRLIKAVAPKTVEDMGYIKNYAVRAILIDARERGLYGGTGNVCDWEMAAAIARERPLILSGGLGPDNLEEAIKRVVPAAVDINSGIEIDPGKKDHEKMRKVVEIAKNSKADLKDSISIFSHSLDGRGSG
jgi:phosphoribosylanthranilate isomerase